MAAARPNFMKVGPVIDALVGRADVELVHTGQHYDRAMSESFFVELGLPEPDVNLHVGSGSHGEQTAAVMVAYENHLQERRPDAVVVVGDVNSTLAATIAATKLRIPVAHVEAGLRSRDWDMPEEVNRVLTDRVSRWLLAPSEDACRNLEAEGAPQEWIHLVGNVMVDTLLRNLDRARARRDQLLSGLGVETHALVTMHRPSNVDDVQQLGDTLGTIATAAERMTVLFPVHPRTRKMLLGVGALPENVVLTEPLGYLDFVAAMDSAQIVFTDSGGVQEETSVLGVPCITVRDNTERPVTCELGTNQLTGTDPAAIRAAAATALAGQREPAAIPYWDGKAGARIADVLLADL
ncbi:non-hydrolyzing UDP-N-acetylglucosamine 2-epimerase [Egicoccus sp. AB-alg2]|uniref:non-hydrolyzing UDP-N-acetylglucosamine 2-epimerase n=1 Tax=Egicoccus sp. AB-alg2 TaxID=3242693 RepID=UPI00359E748A